MFASIFVPGAGSMINGEVGKGMALLLGWIACCFLLFSILMSLIGFFGVIGFWVWAVIDGWMGAAAVNRRNGYQN